MNQPSVSKRQVALSKYASARGNLLLMLAFTVVNIVLLLIGSETMFLFSATVPYFSVILATLEEMRVVMIPLLAIAAVSLAAYLICWIFSKQHFGWMIAALVLFVIDSLCMVGFYALGGNIADGFIDVLIHIWVLYYLIIGVKYGAQLRSLPEEEETVAEDNAPAVDPSYVMPAPAQESVYLRQADMDVKFRVLCEADVNGYQICYRRVKRVNELVINGYVYDEVEMLMETAHELTATVNGQTIVAGFDGAAQSFIKVNGEKVAKKMRLY